MGRMLKPRLDNWQASTSLKMLPAESFRFQHRKANNGYWWRGAEVDDDDSRRALPLEQMLQCTVYGLAYAAAVLLLAHLVFSRRNF